ncbi:MAG: peptidoglycan-binding protein [Christensenellales bacterium]|jgi:lysozyme family protein
MAKTIRNGSRGSHVRTLQTQLNQLGFTCGKVDGVFGMRTEAAVRAYQRVRGLVVDGIVGPKTWGALGAESTSTEPGTAHFKLSEFHCKDGTKVPREYYGNVRRLMDELERIRAVWGKPIMIRSSYRTLAWNRAQGNTTDHSQHLTANAADIVVQGVPAATVYAKLDAMYPGQGVGKYAGFTHLDLRGRRARW